MPIQFNEENGGKVIAVHVSGKLTKADYEHFVPEFDQLVGQHGNRRSPMPPLMHLKVLLPFQIFAETIGVSRIIAETQEGSFGLLPHRLDCVAALMPALGEGRSVATALTALAQQPDASATITRTLFVGLAMIESTAIYCFVVSMILIFANPFWNHVIAQATQAAESETMLIDWFTVGAQALNFLILVWLMKRFLYKPILHAIDEREKRIAKELADADAKKAESQKERDEFQHKNEDFDKQRAALLSKATDEAKAERQRLLDEARKAADALSAKRQNTLKSDAHNLNQAITLRTQQEVFSIARKTLADLATTSLEDRMGEVFTRRLREMNGQAKEGLGNALKKASDPALVRSTFDLPAEQRAAIQNALNETFSADIHLRFETAPDLVSGVELTTNGQKVAWSIADYLASMEKGVGEILKEKDKPQANVEPKPEVPKSEAKNQ